MFKILLITALAALVWAYQSVSGGSIDGSAWDIRLRSDSFFSLPHKDTLVFEKGQLISSRYLSSGFLPAAYSTKTFGEKGQDEWSSSQENLREGSLQWQGKIQGQHIEGTLSWMHKNGKVEQFYFHGKKKV